MLRLNKQKKGQVGDTITWVVATLIIVAILIFFIYVSSALAKTKAIAKVGQGSFSGNNEGNIDWISLKTSFAYEINSNNKVMIEEWLSENGEKS